MKKLLFFFCLLLFTATGFAQEKPAKFSHSYIVVEHSDKRFHLKASFSGDMDQRVIDEIHQTLKEEEAQKTSKGMLWEKYDGKKIGYRILLDEKTCEVLLKKNHLDSADYKELLAMGISLDITLNDKSGKE